MPRKLVTTLGLVALIVPSWWCCTAAQSQSAATTSSSPSSSVNERMSAQDADQPAEAKPDSGFKLAGSVGLGLGRNFGNQNEFAGSNAGKVTLKPHFDFTINDTYFFNLSDSLGLDLHADTRPQLGLYLLDKQGFKLGVAASYETSLTEESTSFIYGADKVKAADIKVFGTYVLGDTQFAARYSRVIGGTDSQKISVGAAHLFTLRPDLFLTMGGSMTWANQKNVDAYYDAIITVPDDEGGEITGRLSELTGAKRPSAGIETLDAFIGLDYYFSEQVSVGVSAGFTYFTNNVYGTPAIFDRFTAGLGTSVSYHF